MTPPKANQKAQAGKTPARPDHLIFVTGNAGKLREMQQLLAPLGIDVEQDDRGYPEIQHDTLGGVAEAGAGYLMAMGLEPPFILEDAGLFITALKGFPGVYSRHALDTIGLQGILRLMQDVELENRGAAFQAHLLYVDAAGTFHPFEGVCKGRIAERTAGDGGFGFDPLFIPVGEDRTFAELGDDEKNQISHRGRAAEAFKAFLAKQERA